MCKWLSYMNISAPAASFYRLFSSGLPTYDLIISPVGTDWDSLLRSLIKTFKLTNWTRHGRSCLGESLQLSAIPTWRAPVTVAPQSNNESWWKVAESSVSHLASSQSLVSSQSVSSSLQKTDLGSPGPPREFINGCAHRRSRDIQLHDGCSCGQTWASYLEFTFHSPCHRRTTGEVPQLEGTWKDINHGLFCSPSCKPLLNICSQIAPLPTNPKYFAFFHLLMWQHFYS